MDWLASVFVYGHPDSILVPTVMGSTFLFSAALALLLRRLSWEAVGFWAGFSVFLFFSVMLTAYNGVRSTASIGGMFMIAYVSIVSFPTAGVVRLLMYLVRRLAGAQTAAE